MSFLVICWIFGLFVNKLTFADKYSLCNSDNLRQSNQMQLSNKYDDHSLSISEISFREKRG